MGFSAPKTLSVAPAKKAKAERPEFTIDGVEKLASLAALINALQSRYDAIDADVRAEGIEYMIAAGTSSGLQPANPIISEGVGSANFQLKSRSSASAITDEVYDALMEAGIPVEIKTVTESYLAVNPAYSNDQDLLAKADKLLNGKAGFPEDFIVQTPGVTKKIVGEGAITKVFATKKADTIRELLPHVSSAVIAQIKVSDFDHALTVVEPEVRALFGSLVAGVAVPAKKGYKAA